MIRLVLILLCGVLLGVPVPSFAQKPSSPPPAAPAISADQARTALEVLNDPAKRAAFAATLNAIVKGQPGGAAAAEPAEPAEAAKRPRETTVEGVHIPLAPNSLGAQVLLSASAFVNQLGVEAMTALNTVQSLPLLYGWAVVMATNPIARDLLVDVTWRVALVLVIAVAVEYGLRRAMQRPIRSLENLAPVSRTTEPEEPPPAEDPEAAAVERAEAGDIESPTPRRPPPSAWTLLKR
ncbi:MAG TPA: hypothetical protein VGF36_00555, partial [Rhodopila sp.]